MKLGPEDPIRELLDDVLDGRANAADVARFESVCRTRPEVAEEFALLRSLRSATLRIGLERGPATLRARIAAAVDAAAASAPPAADVLAFQAVHRRIAWLRTAPFVAAAAALFAMVLLSSPEEHASDTAAHLTAEASEVASNQRIGDADADAGGDPVFGRRPLAIDPAAIVRRMQEGGLSPTEYRFAQDPEPGSNPAGFLVRYGTDAAPPPARWSAYSIETVDPVETAEIFKQVLALLPAAAEPAPEASEGVRRSSSADTFAGGAAQATDDLRLSQRTFDERAGEMARKQTRGGLVESADVAKSMSRSEGDSKTDKETASPESEAAEGAAAPPSSTKPGASGGGTGIRAGGGGTYNGPGGAGGRPEVARGEPGGRRTPIGGAKGTSPLPPAGPVPSPSSRPSSDVPLTAERWAGVESKKAEDLAVADEATGRNADSPRVLPPVGHPAPGMPGLLPIKRSDARRSREPVEETYFVSGASAFAAVERTLVAVGAVVIELPVTTAAGASRPVVQDVLPRTRFMEVAASPVAIQAAIDALRVWPGLAFDAVAGAVPLSVGLSPERPPKSTSDPQTLSESVKALGDAKEPSVRRIRLVVTLR